MASHPQDPEAITTTLTASVIPRFAVDVRGLRLNPGSSFPNGVGNKATVDKARFDKVARDSHHRAMMLTWSQVAVWGEPAQVNLTPTGESAAEVHTKVLSGPSHLAMRKLTGMDVHVPNPE